jgi:hypothetical protein
MTPQTLALFANNLETAAELVEAIDDVDLQELRGWLLLGWTYELVPWGVRFSLRDEERRMRTDVTVRLSAPIPFRPETMIACRKTDAAYGAQFALKAIGAPA